MIKYNIATQLYDGVKTDFLVELVWLQLTASNNVDTPQLVPPVKPSGGGPGTKSWTL